MLILPEKIVHTVGKIGLICGIPHKLLIETNSQCIVYQFFYVVDGDGYLSGVYRK